MRARLLSVFCLCRRFGCLPWASHEGGGLPESGVPAQASRYALRAIALGAPWVFWCGVTESLRILYCTQALVFKKEASRQFLLPLLQCSKVALAMTTCMISQV